MSTDLIVKFSSLAEGELFVKVGEQETLLRKTGSRKAVIAKTTIEKKMFASDDVLTLENAKKYYKSNVGVYNVSLSD